MHEFRVLIVCLGNVCRSPLAERLLARRLDPGDGSFDVVSAGVIGLSGQPMEPRAAAQLKRLGGEPDGFVARRLDSGEARVADLLLTATLDIRRQVLEESPGALRRAFTLREFAGLCASAEPGLRGRPAEVVADAALRRQSVAHLDLDVPDPMGRSDRTHARVADLIDAAVREIAAALVVSGRSAA